MLCAHVCANVFCAPSHVTTVLSSYCYNLYRKKPKFVHKTNLLEMTLHRVVFEPRCFRLWSETLLVTDLQPDMCDLVLWELADMTMGSQQPFLFYVAFGVALKS